MLQNRLTTETDKHHSADIAIPGKTQEHFFLLFPVIGKNHTARWIGDAHDVSVLNSEPKIIDRLISAYAGGDDEHIVSPAC